MKNPSSILVLFALLAPPQVFAQSTAASEAVPRYDVEIVVFRNIKAPKSREFVLPVSSPSRGERILDLSSPASLAAAKASGYEMLPTGEYRLVDIVARLVESARYELLAHVAWRQPGVEVEQALPIWIRGGRIYGDEYTSIDNQIEYLGSGAQNRPAGDDTGTRYGFDEQTLEAQELQMLEQRQAGRHGGLYELEGKVTIALSRYLHAYVDLVLRRPRHPTDAVIETAAQDQASAAFITQTQILDNYRLKERRRMRSKNLHFLDNPEFGMLILITPYQTPDSVEEPLPDEQAPPPAEG